MGNQIAVRGREVYSLLAGNIAMPFHYSIDLVHVYNADAHNVLKVAFTHDTIDDEYCVNHISNIKRKKLNIKKIAMKSNDFHDEQCCVCNTDGELLCCDTCSLVFHLCCLRPTLNAIPDGKWSCPYCNYESNANNDLKTKYKTSIIEMIYLSKLLTPVTTTTTSNKSVTNNAVTIAKTNTSRFNHQVDIVSISKVANKFVLKQNSGTSMTDCKFTDLVKSDTRYGCKLLFCQYKQMQ